MLRFLCVGLRKHDPSISGRSRLRLRSTIVSAAAVASLAVLATALPASVDVASASSSRPGPSNTGVPRGTALRVHHGDLTITRAGTVIDRLDVRGYVFVKADNVTIKRTLIRGGQATQSRALIMSWWGAKNLRVMDSTLRATRESPLLDGISGGSFTAERLQISRVVDPVKVIGNDVYVRRSWLYDTTHLTRDPHTRDGKTHDDSIQITGGTNIRITYNTLEGANNAAIMVSSARYATGAIHVKGNWISGGACTINVTTADRGPIRDMHIYKNKFGMGSYGKTCPMRLPRTSKIKHYENTFSDGTTPRPVSF